MLADRMRMRGGSKGIPSYYVMAEDSDFSGTTDGDFKYIGDDDYIIIPKIIKGVTLTRYNNILSGKDVLGMGCENVNVTNIENMFNGYKGTTIHLEYFNFNNADVPTNKWTNSATMVYYVNSTNEATTVNASMRNQTNNISFDIKIGSIPIKHTNHGEAFNGLTGKLPESGADSPTAEYLRNFRRLDEYYNILDPTFHQYIHPTNISKYFRIKAKIDG